MTHPKTTIRPAQTCPICKQQFVPKRSKPQKYCCRQCLYEGLRVKGAGLNPSGLCLCGCGTPTPIYKQTQTARDMYAGQHARFAVGHRVWSNIDITPDNYGIDPETGCWDWKRQKDGHGYGKISHPTKTIFAHRVAWAKRNGPIPEGMVIDHLCRNPACVNPDHLEPVTIQVNIQRGNNAKLTPDAVRRIRANAERWSIRQWMQEYGVSKTAIVEVRGRRRWQNVD